MMLRCHACMLSHFRLFVTLWTIANQAPLSMGFSRQEYWSGLPCPPPGDLPNLGIEPSSLTSPELARILEWEPFPSPGDLPNPGIKPRSPPLRVDSLPAEPQVWPPELAGGCFTTSTTWEAQ